MGKVFATEAAMCAEFTRQLKNGRYRKEWTAYAETAGFDMLLVHGSGMQIGVEAKLSLNVKVLTQALPEPWQESKGIGPDFRAVLVPRDASQVGLGAISARLGLTIISVWPEHQVKDGGRVISSGFAPSLPSDDWHDYRWFDWCPAERCRLPDFIPDVEAGHPAPVKLTSWKIGAIKLAVLLERRGFLTPHDFKHVNVSSSRWTQSNWLQRGPERGVWLKGKLPDFRAQHPTNFAQIEADFEKWAPPKATTGKAMQGDLLAKGVA
jgi:hypothetical protein